MSIELAGLILVYIFRNTKVQGFSNFVIMLRSWLFSDATDTVFINCKIQPDFK